MLLGEIDALSKNTGWCTAGRQHFADWLRCKPENVSYYTKKLESLGFLEVSRTPGAESKMRVKNAAFYRPEVVNGTDGGSKRDLRGVVNGVYGGSKRGLLKEREYKYNEEREVKERAPAQTEPSPLKADVHESSPGRPAGGAPGWADRPNTNTPAAMVADLRAFYAKHPEDLRLLLDTAKARHSPDDLSGIIAAFCAYRIDHGRTTDTYQRHHAALQKWLIDEKTMRRKPQGGAANEKPAYEPPRRMQL